MGEVATENRVPGQGVLPEMAQEMGYEAIVLKPVQERFCWEYVLRGDNAARAYMVVKPSVKESTARVEASKLLTIPEVRQRVAQIREELKRRYAVTAEDLITYHGKVLKTDRTAFLEVTATGRLKTKDLPEIDPEAASILEFDQERDAKGNLHVLMKVPQRHQSAVELAKILGLHKNQTELSGPGGGPIATENVVRIYIPDNGRD